MPVILLPSDRASLQPADVVIQSLIRQQARETRKWIATACVGWGVAAFLGILLVANWWGA